MASSEKEVPASEDKDSTQTEDLSGANATHPQGEVTEEVTVLPEQGVHTNQEGQVEQEVMTGESSGDQEEVPQQTLYVAIQPGANMDSTQIEQAQPAVFVEVVEAGNGAEISSTGQVVQEEMVIDNSSTEVTTIPTSVLSQVVDQATLSTMQAEMIAVQVLSQSATGDIQYLQQQSPAQFIPIASGADASSLQAALGQVPFATLQIAAPQPGAVTQTIHLPGGQTIQVPISQIVSAASTASVDTTTAVATPLTTTNTEAIMNAVAQSVESAASQGQEGLTAEHSSGLSHQEGVVPEGEEGEGEDGKPKYSCEICGKSYIRSWSYYGHMREHASGEKQHKCEVCGKVFNYASNLRQHMLIHTGEKPYECEYCDKAFNNPSSLRSHVLSHSEDRPFVCDHESCGKAFNNPGSLRVHRRVHQEDKPHRCSHEGCDKAFKTPAELSRHAFRHTGEKPHKCDRCDKAFIRYDDLKRHYRIHTGEKPFKCDQCDFACIQSFDLVKHKFTHSGDKPYKCDICPKQFTRPARLRDHMRTHTGEKPYICEVCGKGFAIQTGLKSHQAVHTGDKPFKCEECDKTFRTQIELQSHMGRHTGVKPFKCDTCDKEFISAITFKRHAIVHSGEKPFECTECGRRFARSTDLKVHMPVHSDDKPYKCGECDKMFTRFSTLKEHIRTHTGERPFKCEECGREFNHRSHFNNHLRIHTGEKPFKCEVCEKDFSRKASLRYHMKVHSKIGSRGRITRPKAPSDDGACDVHEMSTEVTTVDHGMAEQSTSTVNIGQLGNQAEVQLAEALVAVSEGLVMTPQVVAVEETSSQGNEGPAVSVTQQVPGHMMVDPVTQAAVNAGISAAEVTHSVVETVVNANMGQPHHITGPLGNQVVVTTTGAGHGTEGGEMSVGEVLQAEVRQGQVILQTREGGDAMESGATETAAHETVGLSMPVEILAAMAAQMTQLATVPGQPVLESPEGIQQVLETVALQPLQTADAQEQMDTQ